MSVRERLEARLRGEAALPPAGEALLRGASAIYGAAVRAHAGLVASGVMRAHAVGRPVVSVGNITAGGTGKTPLVRHLARALVARGFLPAILLRGYGVSPREPRLAFAEMWRATGDESALLAMWLRGVPVIACRSRRRAAKAALVMMPPIDLFLLDDAFQHHAIARDLDIVLIDATDPWGGGALLPSGRLREPRASIARAGVVVITRASQATDLDALRRQVHDLAPRAEIAAADAVPRAFLGRAGIERRGTSWIEGKEVLAVAGIRRPRAFEATLVSLGARVELAAFADHHPSTAADAAALELRAAGRPIVTTEKDAIRWPGEWPADLWVLETSVSFREGEEALLARVFALAASSRRRSQRSCTPPTPGA